MIDSGTARALIHRLAPDKPEGDDKMGPKRSFLYYPASALFTNNMMWVIFVAIEYMIFDRE
jgi:hypothetical protein